MLESIERRLTNRPYRVESSTKVRGISGIVHEFTLRIVKKNKVIYLDRVTDPEGLLLSYCKAIDLEDPVIIIAPSDQVKTYGFSSGTRIRNIVILSEEDPKLLDSLIDIIEKS